MSRPRGISAAAIGIALASVAIVNAGMFGTPPKKPTIDELLPKLSDTDAVVREAAVRDIASRRGEAARPVVDLLTHNDLAARGAAMELLERWGGPTDGVDPWDRSTLTAPRIAALRAWAAGPATRPSTRPATLPAAFIADDLNVLLAAPNAASIRVVRERLAVAGEAALPAVYDRLRGATNDENRRRLTAMRYRLVASERRAIDWPDGFDRLADADAGRRRAALVELTTAADSNDSRLLLELFSADDPLVRGGALNALRTLGGPEATRSLVQLLNDPSTNVRAAVLKALAADEKPPEALAPALAAYVKREADVDLLSPAIGLLGRMPGRVSSTAILGMLDHAEWRVRAAAVDAIAANLQADSEIQSDSGGGSRPNARTLLVTALTRHLDDPEPFVVSRVLLAMSGNAGLSDINALAKVANRRPELLPDLIAALAKHGDASPAAVPWLRMWSKDTRPAVRRGAIQLLVSVTPNDAETLGLALDDADPAVRAIAFRAVAAAAESLRPEGDTIRTSGFFGFGSTVKHIDMTAWAADFRSGKTRPNWFDAIAAKAITAADGLADVDDDDAATVMALLGRTDRATELLRRSLAAGKADDAVNTLFWLPPTEQKEMLIATLTAAKDEQRQTMMFRLTRLHLPALTDALWQTLADPDVTAAGIAAARQGLNDAYFDSNNTSAKTSATRKTLQDYLATGTVAQKVIALSCLQVLDRAAAMTASEKLLADPKTDMALRRDALQLRLINADVPAATAMALSAFEVPATRDLAVRYLAGGPTALQDRTVRTHFAEGVISVASYPADTRPAPLTVPAGIKPEILRPLLMNDDADVAAYAGYLLVMLDDPAGFEPLKKMWQQNKEQLFSPYHRLLYRAIIKRNDDALTPLLASVYECIKPMEMSTPELYQTMQSLTGSEAVKLRERVAREMGAGRLLRRQW